MKMSTVPFFPASDFSERSLLSTSGSVKSSIVAPIAGGAGTSPSARAPMARTAPAITNNEANRIDRFLFIYKISFKQLGTNYPQAYADFFIQYNLCNL